MSNREKPTSEHSEWTFSHDDLLVTISVDTRGRYAKATHRDIIVSILRGLASLLPKT